ncbi:MAG: FlgO family outer membrane protein [Desulfobulbaceae bacterium]|nr:FlgO family outer membrane protein [Desulfobulbaceae bacterium]
MVRNCMLMMVALLLAPLWIGTGQVWAGQTPPVYNSYTHNYPHEVPSDYVYRTERVFSPPAKKSFFSRLTSAVKNVRVPRPAPGQEVKSAGMAMQERVQDLVQQLLKNPEEGVRDNYVVTVGTFVNMSQLYATSSLGRFISEQLITELQKEGVEVVEVRKTPSIMMSSNDGVFGLSTDMDELSLVHNAQAMVVGTYSAVGGEIFINARLLRNSDNMVLSTGSLTYPMDKMAQALLADEGMPVRSGRPVAIKAFADNGHANN